MPPKKKKDKTRFCAFLFAALLPFTAKAQTVNLDLTYTAAPLGQASQAAAVLYGVDNSLSYTATLRQVAVDVNGNLQTGSGSGTSSANQFAWLTTTAAGTAATGGSITAIALTGTVLTNITFAAGADTPCIVTIDPGAGPNAGFYWGILPSSTWLAPVSYLAVSTTPIMVTVGRGDFLQLSATAAAVTVNARVRYAPIK